MYLEIQHGKQTRARCAQIRQILILKMFLDHWNYCKTGYRKCKTLNEMSNVVLISAYANKLKQKSAVLLKLKMKISYRDMHAHDYVENFNFEQGLSCRILNFVVNFETHYWMCNGMNNRNNLTRATPCCIFKYVEPDVGQWITN